MIRGKSGTERRPDPRARGQGDPPGDTPRSSPYRPNPVRQAIFVGIALVGVAIGYGAGFLFKPDTPPPDARATAEGPADRPYRPPTGPERELRQATKAPPLLPEPAAAPSGTPPRAYEEALPKDIVVNGGIDAKKETPTEAPGPLAAVPPVAKAAKTPKARPDDPSLPPWRRYAVAVPDAAGRPRIAVVIDDLGIDRPRTARVIQLPGPLTLSFLTYASGLPEQTRAARAAGHELLMHIPMEPGSVDVDPGPNVLLTGIPEGELVASLRWNLNQFEAFVGVNNHMGSRFTVDATGMGVVMAELKSRGLLFLDSMTASGSVGRRAARTAGVPAAVRNVFLDHEDSVRAIEHQLAEVESLARRNGAAVAIGHPREATLEALGRWLGGIEAKGFQLVPVSAVVK